MEPFRFGYSEAQITPGLELTLEGYVHRGTMGAGNAGVLDHLFVKVLSLTQGNQEFLIIAVDVCEFLPEFGRRLRATVSSRTGVPSGAIMVAPTHTHSGPVLDDLWGARDLNGQVREAHDSALARYRQRLEETVAATAAQARQDRIPANVSVADHSAVLGYNRRKRIGSRDRMVYSLWENPGVEPDGLYDPAIPVVMIERLPQAESDNYLHPRGVERVVLFNPAFHPVVLGQDCRLVSADYPGAAARRIKEFLGPGTRAMFLLGASGDTHPLLATQSNPTAVEVIGTAVGAGVAAALATKRGCKPSTKMDVTTTVMGDLLEVQILAWGDIAFVGVSAECFTEFGMQLREASPFPCTLIATLANGSIGYIPTRDAFDGGEYEVEIAQRQGIGPDTLDQLTRFVLDSLKEARTRLT